MWTVEIKLSAVLVKTKKQKQTKPLTSPILNFLLQVLILIHTHTSSKEEDALSWRKGKKEIYVIIGFIFSWVGETCKPSLSQLGMNGQHLLLWVKIICSSFQEKGRSYPPDSEFVHSWLCSFRCSLEPTVYIFTVRRHRQSSNSSALLKGSLCVSAQDCKALCDEDCHRVSHAASLIPRSQPRWFQRPGQRETNLTSS